MLAFYMLTIIDTYAICCRSYYLLGYYYIEQPLTVAVWPFFSLDNFIVFVFISFCTRIFSLVCDIELFVKGISHFASNFVFFFLFFFIDMGTVNIYCVYEYDAQ